MDAAAMYKTEVEAAGHVFQANKSWLFSRSCHTLRQAMQHPLAGDGTPRAMQVAAQTSLAGAVSEAALWAAPLRFFAQTAAKGYSQEASGTALEPP